MPLASLLKVVKISFGLFACSVVFALHLSAQIIPTGTISGVVKDPTGLNVGDATVTVINVESNLQRTATTSSEGIYRFPALPVGRYSVKTEIAGFKTTTQSNVSLDVDQEDVVNFSLQVGALEQQVNVSAESNRVDTTTSSLGQVVTRQQVSDLPLNGRNFVDLTLLQTGITQFQSNQFGVNGLFGQFYSSNGAPLRSNMYTLDGAIMGNIQAASASSITGLSLGIDGISEYKVMTNTFSAEYGLVMGSQTTIVTKGGTNRFHGDAYDYIRNSVLNARNYFDLLYSLPSTVPGGGRRIAPFKRNQFGGAIGGPIKKNKTFFFATFEGFRETLNNPPNVGITPTIPAACHTPIVNGVQTVTNTCDITLAAGAKENVAPSMQPILALFPLPNLPGDQFTFSSVAKTRENYVQGRIDHTFSASDSVFARYTLDDANETYPKLFPIFDFGLVEKQQYVTVAENHVFSPTLLNSARLSLSRSNILDSTPSDSNPYNEQLKGPAYACVTGQILCGFNISGVANFSGSSIAAIINVQTAASFGDDLFWTKGRHGLKFGTLINRYDQYANEGAGQKGTAPFASLHNFLLGKYRSYTTYAPGSNALKDMLFSTIGFYAQDDFRATTRLTLNMGLRYEFTTLPREKNGRESYFVDPPFSTTPTIGSIVQNPTYKNFSPRMGFALDVFGNGKTSIKGGGALLYDMGNIGALFGLEGVAMPPFVTSYTVSPTDPGAPATLVFPFPVPAATGSLRGTAPTSVDRNYKSPHMWDYNLAIEQQLPFGTTINIAYAGSLGSNLWQPANEANPNCPLTNSFVPRGCEDFTSGASARPVWVSGKNAAGVAVHRQNPFFSNFALFQAKGQSNYNALEVNLRKRMGHGLEYQLAYTFSKLLDNTEGLSNSDTSGSTTNTMVNPFDSMTDYGPSNFDVKHNLHINVLYHLPKFAYSGVADKVINGWWTGSIVNYRTGIPFSPTISTDRQLAGLSGTNGGLERPDFVTSANIGAVTAAAVAAGLTTCPAGSTSCIPYNPVIYDPKKVITGRIDQWFNPNMFTLPAVGTVGNVGRNILREPGASTWDLSINKDTSAHFLGEQGAIQFRAEAFNILNHTNLGTSQNGGFMSGAVTNVVERPNFTGITNTQTPARQIQFAVKVLF